MKINDFNSVLRCNKLPAKHLAINYYSELQGGDVTQRHPAGGKDTVGTQFKRIYMKNLIKGSYNEFEQSQMFNQWLTGTIQIK